MITSIEILRTTLKDRLKPVPTHSQPLAEALKNAKGGELYICLLKEEAAKVAAAWEAEITKFLVPKPGKYHLNQNSMIKMIMQDD